MTLKASFSYAFKRLALFIAIKVTSRITFKLTFKYDISLGGAAELMTEESDIM